MTENVVQKGGAGKCPKCGGRFVFNPETTEVKCAYCGSIFDSVAQSFPVKNETADKSNESSSQQLFNGIPIKPENLREELVLPDSKEYKCTSCGALVTLSGTSANTTCNYCRNQLTATADKLLRPDGIVPFAVTREKALSALDGFLAKHRLVDKRVFNKTMMGKLEPVYIPYYVTDTEIKAKLTLERKLSRYKGSSGNYTYYMDSIYRTQCQAEVRVDDSEFLALKFDLPGEIVAMVSPFEVSGVKQFDEEMLADVRTEHRNLSFDDLKDVHESDKRLAMKNIIDSAVKNYDKSGLVVAKNVDGQLSEPVVAYVLLPIWIATVKDKDDLYYFVINGVTGETYGRLKVAWGKIPLIFGVASAAVAAILSILTLTFDFSGTSIGDFLASIGSILLSLGFFFCIPLGIHFGALKLGKLASVQSSQVKLVANQKIAGAALPHKITQKTVGYTAGAILLSFFNLFVIYVGMFLAYQQLLPVNENFTEKNVIIEDKVGVFAASVDQEKQLQKQAVELGQKLNMEWVGFYYIDDSGCTTQTTDNYCEQVLSEFGDKKITQLLGGGLTWAEENEHNVVVFITDRVGRYSWIYSTGQEAEKHFSAQRKDEIFDFALNACPDFEDQFCFDQAVIQKSISYVYKWERLDLGAPIFLFIVAMILVWAIVWRIKKRYWGVTTVGELEVERKKNIAQKMVPHQGLQYSTEELISETERRVYTPPSSSGSYGGSGGGRSGGSSGGGGGGGGGRSGGGGRR